MATGIEALTASNSSIFQYSGQSGLPESRIAGNSSTSHWSALSSDIRLINLAVRSMVLQRVITITIEPPGCNLCRGPEEYHSQALSNAAGDMASCSECGSSIIKRSAPRPVIAPPTPAAKYSPPLLVSHRPADLESADKPKSSNNCLYSF